MDCSCHGQRGLRNIACATEFWERGYQTTKVGIPWLQSFGSRSWFGRQQRATPISATVLVWEREARALKRSKKTKQVNVMVVSRGVTLPSCISRQNTHSVPLTIIAAESST